VVCAFGLSGELEGPVLFCFTCLLVEGRVWSEREGGGEKTNSKGEVRHVQRVGVSMEKYGR